MLNSFFSPKSIAVVGVSRDKNKPGRVIFDNLIDEGFEGKVYPMNPKAKEIDGHKIYSVSELPDVDLAIFAIPAKIVPSALKQISQRVKTALILSGGFGESGRKDLDEKLLQVANADNVKIIGPNSLGMINTHKNINATFLPRDRVDMPPKGGVSILSQSGATIATIIDWAAKINLRLSKVIGYGNQLQTFDYELLDYLQNDSETDVIGFYVEGLKDGRKLIEVAKRGKKPVIVLKAGRTNKGQEAAKSHTGAMAGNFDVFKGVTRQLGWNMANDPNRFLQVLKTKEIWKNKVKSVGIVTCGGGYGVMTSDALVSLGLKLPELSPAIKKDLTSKFPQRVSVNNPLDLTGDSTAEMFDLAIKTMLKVNEVDALIIILLMQLPKLDKDVVGVVKKYTSSKKPIIIVSPPGKFASDVNAELVKYLPVVHSPMDAAKILSCLKH